MYGPLFGFTSLVATKKFQNTLSNLVTFLPYASIQRSTNPHTIALAFQDHATDNLGCHLPKRNKYVLRRFVVGYTTALCVYIYICNVHIHTYIYIHVHNYVYIYICVNTYICKNIYIC